MVKELYQRTFKETHLKIIQSNIDAIMKKKITKSGCRVYEGGCMGVAGTLGEPTEDTWKQAEANLGNKIPYPFEPEGDKKLVKDYRNKDLEEELFIKEMESILEIIKKEYPDYIFSNKVKYIESEIRLQNDKGLDYLSCDKSINLEIVIKHKDSINILDSFLVYEGRELNKEDLLNQMRKTLDGLKNKVNLPENKKILVAIQPYELMGKIINSLNGEHMGNGTSLFNDKLNTKVFNENLSVIQGRGEELFHTAFFDMEGTVNADDKVVLIEKGVVLNPYTDKKQAKAYGFPLTGAAGGEYDEIPFIGNYPLKIVPGDKTLKELFGGETGIFIYMASGGDYTNEGNYATPVQMSYLTDGENLIGTLPEFNMSGNLFEMFGEDFVGVSKDEPFSGNHILVLRMNVDK